MSMISVLEQFPNASEHVLLMECKASEWQWPGSTAEALTIVQAFLTYGQVVQVIWTRKEPQVEDNIN